MDECRLTAGRRVGPERRSADVIDVEIDIPSLPLPWVYLPDMLCLWHTWGLSTECLCGWNNSSHFLYFTWWFEQGTQNLLVTVSIFSIWDGADWKVLRGIWYLYFIKLWILMNSFSVPWCFQCFRLFLFQRGPRRSAEYFCCSVLFVIEESNSKWLGNFDPNITTVFSLCVLWTLYLI